MDYLLNEETKAKIIRYTISSLITFSTGVVMTLIGQWDQISLESIRDGSILGVLFLAARAGVKMVFEAFLTWQARRK